MKWRRNLVVGLVALVVVLVLGAWVASTPLYQWMARKTVTGEVVSIANLTPGTMFGNRPGVPAGGVAYSFAVAIKADDGTIYSASAEDRQWAAVKEGYRVRATLFPYSPWNWSKQGTYQGARLRQVLGVPSSRGERPAQAGGEQAAPATAPP
jgi:hypothetical protein